MLDLFDNKREDDERASQFGPSISMNASSRFSTQHRPSFESKFEIWFLTDHQQHIFRQPHPTNFTSRVWRPPEIVVDGRQHSQRADLGAKRRNGLAESVSAGVSCVQREAHPGRVPGARPRGLGGIAP